MNQFDALERAWERSRETDNESEQGELYPTLHALGLGDALARMERLCADSEIKHPASGWKKHSAQEHLGKAVSHAHRAGPDLDNVDGESLETHLVHAAVRALLALAASELVEIE